MLFKKIKIVSATLMMGVFAVVLMLVACGGNGGSDGNGSRQGATVISFGDASFAIPPYVSMNASGNAVAVWHQNSDNDRSIWSNHYVPGKGWGTAELVATVNGDNANAFYPRVSVNASGNAVAVWAEYDDTRWNVWANRYVPGTGWGAAELIETNTGGALWPEVSINANGYAVVVWEQYVSTTLLSVWANRYVPGTGWGGAEQLTSGYASSPTVSVDTGGDAVAVWTQWNDSQTNTNIGSSNRSASDTNWSAAELIGTDDEVSAFAPTLSVDASGIAVAVWFTGIGIGINRFMPGMGWGIAELAEFDNDGDSLLPTISTDGNSNMVVVWPQADGNTNIYPVGFNISTGANGNTVAVWEEEEEFRVVRIWANRYVPGEGWGTAELIVTGDVSLNFGTRFFAVSVDGNGNAIVAWSQAHPTGNDTPPIMKIWAKRLQAEL